MSNTLSGRFYLPEGHRVWTRLRGLDLMEVWTLGIKGVLSLMIVTLLASLTGGVLKIFFDLWMLADHQTEVVLRQVIIDMLMLLAVVEVFKTTVTYFSEGRVKVTFIVDTILVVMLTEVISQWFKGGDWQPLAALGGILLTLGIVRVMVVRWSPTQTKLSAYSYMAHANEGGRT
ncbi:MAG: phosphate-starvation-inducible PsiE family protein [Nitrospira sp.]|nr:phosphate-starvation-inducible PsiE family protein [Nitrospira sp.]